MPNTRYAEIKVTGRKESIEEFIKILNDESNMKFYKRIRKTDLRYIKEDIYTQRLSIICNDGIENPRGVINLNPIINTFEEASKKLRLDIEACFKTSDLDVVECLYVQNGILLNNLLIGGKYYA